MKYNVLQNLLQNSLLSRKSNTFTKLDIIDLVKFNNTISNYDLVVNGKDITNIKLDIKNGVINLEV